MALAERGEDGVDEVARALVLEQDDRGAAELVGVMLDVGGARRRAARPEVAQDGVEAVGGLAGADRVGGEQVGEGAPGTTDSTR